MAGLDVTQDPEFLPLYPTETEDAILARWADWANEGLDPVVDVDEWVDTREGGHWRTVLTPAQREFARMYDLLGTEVLMAAMILWSWGTYLDDLAAAYEVVRKPATPALGAVTFRGAQGLMVQAGSDVGVTPATPDAPAPEFEVTLAGTIPAGGSIDLPVQATEAGPAGNVGALAITAPSTPLPGITFSNAAPTEGGSDPETDEALRLRLIEALAGAGGGSKRDYRKWAGDWPGVGRVAVISNWNGAGTVLVAVTDANGQSLPAQTVTDLQNYLDPTVGQGDGVAPVGAIVTVVTATLVGLTISATVTPEPGYSLDGTGGTIALRQRINDRLVAYIEAVAPGDSIVFNHVLGIIATTPGVHDVANVLLDGAAVNVALTTAPNAQVAYLQTLTLA